MKTAKQLKLQRASLALSVAIMQLDGKLTKAQAAKRHNKIWRAYLNCSIGEKIY